MSHDPTAIDIDFDPTVQRMRGVAVHGHTPFDVTFVSHITGNLYSGGCENGLILPPNIEHLVSLYPWESYEILHEGLKTKLEVTMYDSLDESAEQLDAIAEWVVACCEQGPTLVHCQAGLNRSGLVAARALMLMGHSALEAIALLRARRSPAVLCNTSFERLLISLDEEV